MMRIKKAEFLKSCTRAKEFPDYSFPEFAFMGRSNVGKSSLINMILNRKALVKVGSKPGVTRTINFLLINDAFSIADLPGFGYAKLPRELRRTFLPLIREYINSRDNLRLAFLLVDIRRIPDEFERDIITLLSEKGIPTAITVTKCDKLSKNQRHAKIRDIAQALQIDTDSLFMTSAKTGEGRIELLSLLETPPPKDGSNLLR
jgi:GTP-binding protein